MALVATCLGFPCLGAGRALEKALAAYGAGQITGETLREVGRSLRARHWSAMKAAGLCEVPTNDFSFCDRMLDTAVMVGATPARYATIADPLARTFAMAHGLRSPTAGTGLPALAKANWFDTDCRHVVPELQEKQTFHLDADRIFSEIEEARALGLEPRPALVGPVTFLKLSTLAPGAPARASTLNVIDRLIGMYEQLLDMLDTRGVSWVQLDEPYLVMDLDGHCREAYRRTFDRLTFSRKRPRLMLTTYFGALGPNLAQALRLGCEGLHVDLSSAPDQLDAVLADLPATTVLSVGVVDGRHVGPTDFDAALAAVSKAVARLGRDRVRVASSCSLLHLPANRAAESTLEPSLAIASQKLKELVGLAVAADHPANAHARHVPRLTDAEPL
ncbi:MAG TPA: hypothetical protein VMI74_15600 [Burkholderiales bacterium]|nr:hypothetical protein [Burkholderiales bacterium]